MSKRLWYIFSVDEQGRVKRRLSGSYKTLRTAWAALQDKPEGKENPVRHSGYGVKGGVYHCEHARVCTAQGEQYEGAVYVLNRATAIQMGAIRTGREHYKSVRNMWNVKRSANRQFGRKRDKDKRALVQVRFVAGRWYAIVPDPANPRIKNFYKAISVRGTQDQYVFKHYRKVEDKR